MHAVGPPSPTISRTTSVWRHIDYRPLLRFMYRPHMWPEQPSVVQGLKVDMFGACVCGGTLITNTILAAALGWEELRVVAYSVPQWRRRHSTELTFTDRWTPLCSNCSYTHTWSCTRHTHSVWGSFTSYQNYSPSWRLVLYGPLWGSLLPNSPTCGQAVVGLRYVLGQWITKRTPSLYLLHLMSA